MGTAAPVHRPPYNPDTDIMNDHETVGNHTTGREQTLTDDDDDDQSGDTASDMHYDDNDDDNDDDHDDMNGHIDATSTNSNNDDSNKDDTISTRNDVTNEWNDLLATIELR